MILSEQYETDMKKFLEYVSRETYSKKWQHKKNGGYYYYNIPIAFDIETSSFFNEKQEKQAIMYIWQVCFNGKCFIGRTWDQFLLFCYKLVELLRVDVKNRIIIYVHNLSYEFQFMRKYFSWVEFFAVADREPIKICCDLGIEFRDSYILSGYSLEKTAEQLRTYKIKKLVGFLNYDKIRTSKTELTHNEMLYCIYDVLVVCAYIQEQIDELGSITKIPLTNTGRVRNYCRNACYNGFEGKSKETKNAYKQLMQSLTLEVEEYKLLKRCFMGGFTHTNFTYAGDTMKNVSSFDFTSSYPYVMVSEKFPMGKGFRRDVKTFDEYRKLEKNFLMIFDIEMIGVSPKLFQDSPLSLSKCAIIEKEIVNNGRVMYADRLVTSGTNIDLDIYLQFYNIEHLRIFNCYIYYMDYLPKNFILSILKLYSDKTTLKGVEGKEVEYLHSKGMLNSCYGMCVTDIVQDNLYYSENDEYITEKSDINEQIEAYNTSKNRFLFYPWGVFVTAYARRNLFTAIKMCGNDYVYSDTDSVKIINKDNHKEYFEKYNNIVKAKLEMTAKHYDIDFSLFAPKTIKGVEKMLGVWDYEGTYKYFKSLRAKCYLYTDENNKLHATVAGCGKSSMTEFLQSKYKTDNEIYKHFATGLYIPPENTGKLTHTYIDDTMQGTIEDYRGASYNYYELSGIHLSKAHFEISLGNDFLNFLRGYKYKYTF